MQWLHTLASSQQNIRSLKPKFHYADFPVTSATSLRQTRDVPFSPLILTRGSIVEVGVMEFGLN